VRLSGINISVADEERPLLIKVASIPQAKLQVYFIDNDDFFQRKHLFADKNDKQFEDNDERAIFFSKGVIETVRKLGWSPDIVHCHDWMSGLIPFYLRTTYKNDPLFKNTKIAFTLFDTPYRQIFTDLGLKEKVRLEDITDEDLKLISGSSSDCFIKAGVAHSDMIIKSSDSVEQRYPEIFEQISFAGKRVETITLEDMTREFFADMYCDALGELKMV